MKDDRTAKQKYQAWIDSVNLAHEKGWKCQCEYIFYSPSGSMHDLCTADFNQLDRIERDRLFII